MLLGKRFSRFQKDLGCKATVALRRKDGGEEIVCPRKFTALFMMKAAKVEGIKKKALLRHTKKFSESFNKKED